MPQTSDSEKVKMTEETSEERYAYFCMNTSSGKYSLRLESTPNIQDIKDFLREVKVICIHPTSDARPEQEKLRKIVIGLNRGEIKESDLPKKLEVEA